MSPEALTVGIPREIKPGEKRVALTPSGVGRLTQSGIPVLIEEKAGTGCGLTDRQYREAGAEICGRAADLYQKTGLIKKVKEPYASECKFLRPDLLILCFLHLASPENRGLLEVLLEKQVIAIGLETVEKEGRTILLAPMSEIAGALAAYDAGFFTHYVRVEKNRMVYPARFLEKLEQLSGLYPEAPENLSPGKVVIFGGGVVGHKAAEILLKMGAEVHLVEKSEARAQTLKQEFASFGSRFITWRLEDNFRDTLVDANVWIGAVHRAGERAPLVLSPEDLRILSGKKRKLILDIAVDQGGNFPETHSTSYEDPLFLDSCGNLRFGVTNIPSLCPRVASEAIEKATLPYAIELARDWKTALQKLPELQKGLHTFRGKLFQAPVAEAHGLSWQAFDPSILI